MMKPNYLVSQSHKKQRKCLENKKFFLQRVKQYVFHDTDSGGKILTVKYCSPFLVWKWQGWLGLGSRHFLYHYPRYWLPSSVSITQCMTTETLSYPYLHSNPALWNVFTVSLEWIVMKQVRTPRWPVVVHSSLNCHWSTAFISIKLEEPPVAFSWSAMDSHISLEWDFKSCIRLQLVEWAIL